VKQDSYNFREENNAWRGSVIAFFQKETEKGREGGTILFKGGRLEEELVRRQEIERIWGRKREMSGTLQAMGDVH